MKRLRPEIDSAHEKQYCLALKDINSTNIPYLVGAGLAFAFYTDFPRRFNDLDLFCKAGDYPKILESLERNGFQISVPDEKWLAKATKENIQIDILFSSPNGLQNVDDTWLENGRRGELFGVDVNIMGPEELFWCKIYVQNTTRFDGADINHLILKIGNSLDWKKILLRMETDWEVLLAAILNYRFVFPSERENVPEWLMHELIERLRRQIDMPSPEDRICRGPLLSRADYLADIQEGGFII